MRSSVSHRKKSAILPNVVRKWNDGIRSTTYGAIRNRPLWTLSSPLVRRRRQRRPEGHVLVATIPCRRCVIVSWDFFTTNTSVGTSTAFLGPYSDIFLLLVFGSCIQWAQYAPVKMSSHPKWSEGTYPLPHLLIADVCQRSSRYMAICTLIYNLSVRQPQMKHQKVKCPPDRFGCNSQS